MLNSLKVYFEQPEYSALIRLAEQELRSPADLVRLLVRMELLQRGLLPNKANPPAQLLEKHIETLYSIPSYRLPTFRNPDH